MWQALRAASVDSRCTQVSDSSPLGCITAYEFNSKTPKVASQIPIDCAIVSAGTVPFIFLYLPIPIYIYRHSQAAEHLETFRQISQGLHDDDDAVGREYFFVVVGRTLVIVQRIPARLTIV